MVGVSAAVAFPIYSRRASSASPATVAAPRRGPVAPISGFAAVAGTAAAAAAAESVLRAPRVATRAASATSERALATCGGGSSLTTSVLNLSKNIIGAGMLSLPFAMKSAGVVPFLFGLAAIGAMNAYTFFLLGWCCRKTGARSFGELWSKTFGNESAWIADVSVLLNNGLACLAYCVLIGDFLSKALEGLLPTMLLLHSRGLDLVLVAVLLLVPLSLLQNLAPLRSSSIVGLAATLYGFLLLCSDCATNVDVANSTGPVLTNFFAVRVDFFQAVALFSSAFMAHYNSPKFYADLEDNTLPRFAALVSVAFGLAFLMFAIFGFSGFALFGYGVEGNVLKNYSGGTKVMLAWLGMAFSVVFTYPLVFSTFRESCSALLSRSGFVKDAAASSFRVPFTLSAVALTVLGGTVFSNVAVVNGVKGAVLSACLAFIYPAIIHLRLSATHEQDSTTKLMRTGSTALIVTGAGLGILALLAMFVLPKTDFSAFAAQSPAL
eukprot:CAMPEP_0117578312 /NCGR_PEP_ID=MMETSP0784-20121206/63928_1 /TAXON_ID=39447 /ORGANISM="" /LENGTH=492 /DNA_ID=CAMNT_0005377951 /DNA_START=44 /DNA_END=1522 /DNA_ORIENTATION=-